MTTNPSAEYRRCWELAAAFPADKEAAYPEMAVVHDFDGVRGKRVLEYGCGGGSDTMSFLRRGAAVWYAEIVASNLEKTKARVAAEGLEARGHPLLLERSDAIKVEDRWFDRAYANGVLHHIEDVHPVVVELHRVLRPGGILIAMLYTEMLWARCVPQIDLRVASGASKTPEEAFCTMTDYGAPYATSYTENEGVALFEGAGFRVVSTRMWNNGDFRSFIASRP